MAYTPEQMRAVVARAVEVASVAVKKPTQDKYLVGGVEFDLLRGSRCQEFVRECFESALGWPEKSWRYALGSAKLALRAMEADGFRVTGAKAIPRAGDVIGHLKYGSGHIALVVGKRNGKLACAENTISSSRGTPKRTGTKFTPLEDMEWTYLIRFCSEPIELTPTPAVPTAPKTIKLVELITGRELGELTQEAAALLAEGKLTVAPNGDHRKDQGKLYIAKR